MSETLSHEQLEIMCLILESSISLKSDGLRLLRRFSGPVSAVLTTLQRRGYIEPLDDTLPLSLCRWRATRRGAMATEDALRIRTDLSEYPNGGLPLLALKAS